MNFIEELTELCKKHSVISADITKACYELVTTGEPPTIVFAVEFKLPPRAEEHIHGVVNRGGRLV